MAELSIKEVMALYKSDSLQLTAPYRLYRLDGGDNRFYYTIDPETGEPEFFTSWTSMISVNLPKNEYLIKWMIEMGEQAAKSYMMERASYGTFMHGQIEDFMMQKEYNFDLLYDRLLEWELSKSGHPNARNWYWEMRKDMLSFVQFAHDVDLEPFAIEIALASKELGCAGSLDLVCKMNVEEKGFFGEVYKSGENKGKPKESKRVNRVRAIVDFKSGKHGFYDGHIIQLHGYRHTWNENFPDLKIDRVFNWAPNDWRENPGYKLEEQTNKWQGELVYGLCALNKIRVDNDALKPKDVMIIKGKVEFGTDVASVYSKKNISEYIKENGKNN
jgi:hypothetical protein